MALRHGARFRRTHRRHIVQPAEAVQVRRDKVQAAIEARVAESKVEKTEGLSPDLLNKTDILGN